jgi:hypothetical protein
MLELWDTIDVLPDLIELRRGQGVNEVIDLFLRFICKYNTIVSDHYCIDTDLN